MKVGFLEFVAVILIASLCSLNAVFGIRFTITIEECFSHDVKYEGDRIHVSFVVIKVNSGWPSIHEGVDLVVSFLFLCYIGFHMFCFDLNKLDSKNGVCNIGQVKGPSGDQIHVSRDRISEKFWFLDNKKGAYRFCFRNKSPNQETVDFDLHESHFSYHDQHAEDGNLCFHLLFHLSFAPLLHCHSLLFSC